MDDRKGLPFLPRLPRDRGGVRFLMAFRQFPGPLALTVVAALAMPVVGCSLSHAPATAFGNTNQPSPPNAPSEPTVPQAGGQAAPVVSAGARSSGTDPAVLSPLALAMIRADSLYERGVQALHKGNSDQAEWEFDAALEALVDTGLAPTVIPRLVEAERLPPVSTDRWVLPTLPLPRDSRTDVAPNDPDEPTQDAPVLLGPEDMQAIGSGPSEGTAALPEPDIQKYEFPIVFNDQVKTFIQYFQTKKWNVITQGFERASRYLPMMRQIFREKGLPEELLNLAFIESAVNPWATSRVKAAGIWQFMASTARLYGMQVSWWVDERRDPEKATRGAANYLKNLYQMFGSWELALAAYNAGEGKVQRTIDRQRSRDFWRLRLPKETQLFVPAFMAMTIISKEPDRYGFSPPPEGPFAGDTVTLDHPADFRTLAQAAGIRSEQLREVNPALIRWSTPPGAPHYRLRIPVGVNAESLLDELSRIPPRERVAWTTYRVRKGDTAPYIAKRYGTSLQALLEMNGLKKRQPLTPGGALLVPTAAAAPAMTTADAAEGRPRLKGTRTKTVQHTVQKGETVTKIASAYRVSPEELKRANDLQENASLRPGRTLKVPAAKTPEISSSNRKNLASAVARPLSTPPAERRYIVKPGDTVATIARAHGVSPEDLRRWNRLSHNVSLRPGKEIRIVDSRS